MIISQDKYTHWCAHCDRVVVKSHIANRKHIDCSSKAVRIETVEPYLKDPDYPDHPHLELVKAKVANASLQS